MVINIVDVGWATSKSGCLPIPVSWHGYHPYVCVFSALYLIQEGGGELICSDGGSYPLNALLEGALGLHGACQL
jgi:hypothetical protein